MEPRAPPQPYWGSLAGKKQPLPKASGRRRKGAGHAERRRWEERECCLLRKKKRKGRAEIDNPTPTAHQVSGEPLSLPPPHSALPKPAWSVAHPFSELLHWWSEVRGKYGFIRKECCASLAQEGKGPPCLPATPALVRKGSKVPWS